jgi:hypothetical protein
MAVSIDTVYQRVLVLANKEQRGYITPQEFNLLANHAQMEIFEQYFYDINQFNRIAGNTQEYSDMLTLLYEKIAIFEDERSTGWMSTNMPIIGDQWMTVPENLIYRLGTVRVGANQCEMLNSKDFDLARQSPLTSPTLTRPIAYLSQRGLSVFTSASQFITHANVQDIHGVSINLSFTMIPPTVQWAYVIVNDKPLYNDNISVSFKLHASEETELVYKILKLAGVNLKAPQVVQVAAGMEQSQLQQEKQ